MSDLVTNEVTKQFQRGLNVVSDIDDSIKGTDSISSNEIHDESSASANQIKETSSPSKESSSIQWFKTVELNYEFISTKESGNGNFSCLLCGANNVETTQIEENSNKLKKLLKCSKCHRAEYCSKTCQISDWKSKKNGHKKICTLYCQLQSSEEEICDEAKKSIREMLLSKIQIYANSYAVHNCFAHGIGRGFLFLQSNLSLQQLLFLPKHENNVSANQSLLLHYLTLGEYDQEVCREDFELAMIRQELVSLLETYDRYEQVIYVVKFRCGHLALGCIPMKPAVDICKKLATDYFSHLKNQEALQLNLDSLEVGV